MEEQQQEEVQKSFTDAVWDLFIQEDIGKREDADKFTPEVLSQMKRIFDFGVRVEQARIEELVRLEAERKLALQQALAEAEAGAPSEG